MKTLEKLLEPFGRNLKEECERSGSKISEDEHRRMHRNATKAALYQVLPFISGALGLLIAILLAFLM